MRLPIECEHASSVQPFYAAISGNEPSLIDIAYGHPIGPIPLPSALIPHAPFPEIAPFSGQVINPATGFPVERINGAASILPPNPSADKNHSPKYELADIFRLYGKQYRETHHMTPNQLDVMRAIENCRTGFYGYHIDVCNNCGHTETVLNSCRNRHCPKCQGNKRREWTQARMADVLPVPYYHVVATLPDTIFPLCLYNQKIIYDLLFSCFAQTLQAFGKDPKWLGAKIGFFMVLHTWGQMLNVHLHLHVIVPAGGIDEAGVWVSPKYEKNNFLFPVHAVSKVFCGKYIAGLKEVYKNGKLNFPGELSELKDPKNFEKWLNKLVAHKWVVYSKAPFSDPMTVIEYVSRYTHRVAISNSRILSIDNGIIRFSYKNYKKKNQVEKASDIWEETEMPADEFIRRFLYHAVPKRYHRIRHYGFLSNGQKAQRTKIKESLKNLETIVHEIDKTDENKGVVCERCKTGVMISVVVVNGRGLILKGSIVDIHRLRTEIRGINRKELIAYDTS